MRLRQAGQSCSEFLLVVATLIAMLWSPLNQELIPALHRYYNNIIYPISLP